MPIFEYDCRDCGNHFEVLVRGRETAAECPACSGHNIEKALSTFAVGSGSQPAPVAAGPCGRCGDPRGPGACSLN
ncbi:MAG TPA: zinc ribbon domain-containing protein [Vicinamibacterales bacterium]